MALIDTDAAGHRLPDTLVVPGEHHRPDPPRLQVSHRLPGILLDDVGEGKKPDDRRFGAGEDDGLPLPLQAVVLRPPRTAADIGEERLVPEEVGHAVDPSPDTPAGDRRKLLHVPEGDSLLPGTPQDCLRYRVAGACLKRCGDREHLSRRHPEGNDVVDLEPPGREGPGLVKDDHPGKPHGLEGVPALDEHTVMRRGRDPRDHRNRGGYRKRTGAGDDEQDQRPVEGLKERDAEDERRDHDKEPGDEDDRRGVVAGEPLDEGLGGGGVGLSLSDQGHDPGYGARLLRLRHPDLQVAVHVPGPGVDLVPDSLCHRDALSGDRGLVDRRLAERDDTVQRDRITRPCEHGLADQNVADWDDHFPVVPPDPGRLRRDIEERRDRAMRPPGRILLQELGDGVEVEHGRALGRVCGQERASRRDRDEHGDVEPEPYEREESGLQDVVA